MLALNPRAIADARARDATRAAGRVLGPFARRADRAEGQHRHDRAADHRRRAGPARPPAARRLARRRGHESRRRRHSRQGEPRRVSVRRLRHQHVGGTVGNAYDPSLSTAGSSGGSATAVATSLAALGFGTDTCNSLSNPSGFASLATIRTTRGSPAAPASCRSTLTTTPSARWPRSVRDVALALDLVTGAGCRRSGHARGDGPRRALVRRGSRRRRRLKGARIGVFRQRFVGITGEREVAETMDRVIKELQAGGATVRGRGDSRLRREVSRRPRQRARIAARRDGTRI